MRYFMSQKLYIRLVCITLSLVYAIYYIQKIKQIKEKNQKKQSCAQIDRVKYIYTYAQATDMNLLPFQQELKEIFSQMRFQFSSQAPHNGQSYIQVNISFTSPTQQKTLNHFEINILYCIESTIYLISRILAGCLAMFSFYGL